MDETVKGSGHQSMKINTQQQRHHTPFSKFEYAISSNHTKIYYHNNFKKFLEFFDMPRDPLDEGINKLYNLIKQNGTEWFSDCLLDYISTEKKRMVLRQISAGTLRNCYKPVKLFCDMNDILLNWKMISKGMPSSKRAAQDRAPTLSEIQKLLEFPSDERIKPMVLLMVSTGIRLGAWEYLKWKHVTPIFRDEILVAGRLIVYAGEPEQYYTFMTPEAYNALKDWMDFRASFGEKVTGESWLIRDKWQTTHKSYHGRYGMAGAPKKLSSSAIQNLFHHIYFKQNIRPLLEPGQRNHEFKALHGFRKYYKTVCEQVMKPANVELLIGHDLGLSQSYYKPTESQLLEDYLKVVNALTIDKAFKLQEKLLETKKENDIYRRQIEDYKDLKSKMDDFERRLNSK